MHRIVTATAATVGVLAGLVAGTTLGRASADTEPDPVPFACRVAYNASVYYLDHRRDAGLRQLALRSSRECARLAGVGVHDGQPGVEAGV